MGQLALNNLLSHFFFFKQRTNDKTSSTISQLFSEDETREQRLDYFDCLEIVHKYSIL